MIDPRTKQVEAEDTLENFMMDNSEDEEVIDAEVINESA